MIAVEIETGNEIRHERAAIHDLLPEPHLLINISDRYGDTVMQQKVKAAAYRIFPDIFIILRQGL